MDEIIKNLPDLEQLSDDYEKVKNLCLKSKKYSEFIKATDSEVRMQGGFKDRVETDQKIKVEGPEQDELQRLRKELTNN